MFMSGKSTSFGCCGWYLSYIKRATVLKPVHYGGVEDTIPYFGSVHQDNQNNARLMRMREKQVDCLFVFVPQRRYTDLSIQTPKRAKQTKTHTLTWTHGYAQAQAHIHSHTHNLIVTKLHNTDACIIASQSKIHRFDVLHRYTMNTTQLPTSAQAYRP